MWVAVEWLQYWLESCTVYRCAQEELEETKSSDVAVKMRDGNGGIWTVPDAG